MVDCDKMLIFAPPKGKGYMQHPDTQSCKVNLRELINPS